jgi:hypothetical protein
MAQEALKRTPEQEAQIARAREILEDARKAAFTVPKEQAPERAMLLQGIALALAEAGDVDGAMLSLDALDVQHPMMKTQVLALVAVQQARNGDVNAALTTLNSVEDEGARAMALMHVVSQLAQQGYPGAARQFIDQIEDETYKDRALSSLAFHQLAAGDVAGARLTASEIEDEEMQKRVTDSIAVMESQPPANRQAQVRAGQFPAMVLGRPGTRPETASFRVWLPTSGLLVAADAAEDDAVTRVREMVRDAIKQKDENREAALVSLQEAARLAAALTNESDRSDQLSFVAIAQAELGDVERARQTAGLLFAEEAQAPRARFNRVSALRFIGMAQGASGAVDEALAWADSQTDPAQRATVLLGAAEGILRRVEMDSWPAYMHEHIRKEQR